MGFGSVGRGQRADTAGSHELGQRAGGCGGQQPHLLPLRQGRGDKISSKWKKGGWRVSLPGERGESGTLPPVSPQSCGRHPCAGVPLEAAGDSSRHQPTPRCKHPALVRGKETPRKLLLLCSSKQKRFGSPGCGSALAGVRLSPRSP